MPSARGCVILWHRPHSEVCLGQTLEHAFEVGVKPAWQRSEITSWCLGIFGILGSARRFFEIVVVFHFDVLTLW